MVWFLLVPGITSSSSSTVNCRVNKSIYTAMFRKTLYAKAYWIIPWIWLFCTESKGRHPHFSKESFWHKMHCFSQIWQNYFCWYYKLFHFFLPSSSAQHFYLWYKDENSVREINILLKTRNNQRLWSAGNNNGKWKCFGSNAVLCASYMIDGPNTHDQMPSDRASTCAWSNCVTWIPLIPSGSPNECSLHTCDASIITTWRLGLRAALVALNKCVNNSPWHKLKIGPSRPHFEGLCKCPMFYFCSRLADQLNS